MGASVTDKISPFSTPTKRSPKLTYSSVEAKENRPTSPSFANQMKSSTKKNFMSPTISAASKTVAQRKKFLAERKGGEATEPTCTKFHRQRSSSLDLKQGSVELGSSTDSLTSSIYDISSVEDGEDAAKLKPYDPVLNYCSPRPKFLLYKPDRRGEILQRYEMIDCVSSESESSGEHEECLVKQLDEESGGSVEEINEEIEEVGKTSEDRNEVTKNTEERKEAHEGIENHPKEIKEDHIQATEIVIGPNLDNHLELETRSTMLANQTSEIKSEALQTKDDEEMTIQSMEMEDEDEREGDFEEEGEVERCWSFKRLLNIWLVIVILGLSTLYLSLMNSVPVGLYGDDWKVHSGLYEAPFIYENASGSVIQYELAKMGIEEASHIIKGDIIIREPDSDNGETTEGVDEMKNEGSHVTDLGIVFDHAKLNGVSTADQVEAAEDDMYFASTEIVSEEIYHAAGAGNAGVLLGEEFVPVEETATSDISLPDMDIVKSKIHDVVTEVVEPFREVSETTNDEMDMPAVAKFHTEVTVDETAMFEDASREELEVDETAVFEDESVEELEVGEDWGLDHVTERVTDGMLNNLEKVKGVSEMVSTPVTEDNGLLLRYPKETDKAAIIGVVASLLLAFVGFLGFQKLKRTNKTLQHEAAGIPEQDAFRRQHHVKQVESLNSDVGAPRVELLGEYTFCEQEVSSYSLRTNYVENYNDNTCSFSQRNMKKSGSQPAVSGFSSTTETPPYGGQSSQRRSLKKELPTSSIDSPSYGSFTTEMLIRKKEEARGGDKIIVTPIRRSSRIQSRMTPGASR